MLKQKKMIVLLLCIALAFSGCSKPQKEMTDTVGGNTYPSKDNQAIEGNAAEGTAQEETVDGTKEKLYAQFS